MKVTLVQLDSFFEDISKNFSKVEEILSKTKETDVVIFPETWNTGFFPKNKIETFADKDGKRTKEIFSKFCLKNNINAVAGSILNEKNDKIYNTSYIFDRKGQVIADYDKIHLFSPAGENDYFISGNKITTFEIDGVLCGVVICYDIRFLELVRSLALKDIKILFVVAQWPDVRVEHWELINRVRAIENQMFVVAVNGCGKAGDVKNGGHSLVIDPWGKILLSLGDTEEIKSIDLDLSIVDDIRKRINIYNDRKPNLYKID